MADNNSNNKTEKSTGEKAFSKSEKPEKPDKLKIITWTIVVIFILIFLVQNYLVINQGTTRHEDHHTLRALVYYKLINFNHTQEMRKIKAQPYPPITYLVTMVYFKLFGPSMKVARHSMSFFCIIFLLAMFGIGYELGNHYSGLAVMALAGSSPYLVTISRAYLDSFPQTAFTALAFYLLLKTNKYRNRKYCFLFAGALILSFLTKWSTAFFMIVPVLWFLAPNLTGSKRALRAFGIFALIISPSVFGSLWFFKNLNEGPMVTKWYWYYFFIIVVPSLLLLATARYFHLRWKKEKVLTEKVEAIINFAYVSSVFLILASCWYFWAGISIKSKIDIDAAGLPYGFHSREVFIKTKRSFTFNFFKSMYNLAPILMLVGLVYLYLLYMKRENLYDKLVLPVNVLVPLLVLMPLTSPRILYLISTVIFAAALGGYWVSYTGKAKKIITGFIMVISIISILAWAVIPGDIPMYKDVTSLIEKGTVIRQHTSFPLIFPAILCPEGPGPSYDLSSVITHISTEYVTLFRQKPWINVLTVYHSSDRAFSDTFPFNDPLQCGIMRQGIMVETMQHYMVDPQRQIPLNKPDLNVKSKMQSVNPYSSVQSYLNEPVLNPKARGGNFDYIVIFHDKGMEPTAAIDAVMNYFQAFSRNTGIYDIGQGLKATVISLSQ